MKANQIISAKSNGILLLLFFTIFSSCNSNKNIDDSQVEVVKSIEAAKINLDKSFMTTLLNDEYWATTDISGGSFMSQINIVGRFENNSSISINTILDSLEVGRTYEIYEGAPDSLSEVSITYEEGEMIFSIKKGFLKFTEKSDHAISGHFEGLLTDFTGKEKKLKHGKFSLKLR